VFKTVIWATDGSDEALVALPLARELAGERDAHLAVVHAYEVVPSRGGAFMRQLDELDVQEQLRDHVEWLRSDGVDANSSWQARPHPTPRGRSPTSPAKSTQTSS
jgi:nucleotide-binding universal stress UspA family protein